MYVVYRKKFGTGWKLPLNATELRIIFRADELQEARQFIEDDIADNVARWPELGEPREDNSKPLPSFSLGTKDFSLEYWVVRAV